MIYRDRCMEQLGRLLDMKKQLSDDELIELGRRHLLEKELRDWSEMRRAALAEAAEATKRIKDRLAEMQTAGTVNEVEMSELLGVDRMTVRNWLGKQRRKPAAGGSTEVPVETSLLS